MLSENYLIGFKRYALYEKEITPKATQSIINSTKKLFEVTNIENLKDITTDIIRGYLYDQKEQRLWTAKTFRNKRQHLKSFFDYCVSHEYISKNPVEKIGKPKLPKTTPRFIKTQDLLFIIAHTELYPWRYEVERTRNNAIISTFLFTGMRLSELLNLQLTDVNIEEQEIIIKKGKGKKERIVPIHHKLLPQLKRYLKERKRCKNQSIWFFQSLKLPTQITPKTIHIICKKISKASGVKFTPHNLRHSFARGCMNSGLGLYQTKEILGHASVSTTEIYLSIAKNTLKKSFSEAVLV
ncbi:tyrosine-type recombinase/integrase [Tenacibaculum agarivorans]|uniref:tyrosine-type recombinase/integrase n=1 Tax=Tenacibaculum agarivorans TaxID=1908389 RepID=UPI00094BB225|nr:tyrosine-type recombinase/integrase [Tenacibaculum agarivorans]